MTEASRQIVTKYDMNAYEITVAIIAKVRKQFKGKHITVELLHDCLQDMDDREEQPIRAIVTVTEEAPSE